MCLQTVTRRIKKPTRKVRQAYKVLLIRANGRITNISVSAEPTIFEPGKWMTAQFETIPFVSSSEGFSHYRSGFHVITGSKKSAIGHWKTWKSVATERVALFRVEVRRVRTIGRELNGQPDYGQIKVCVADEIKVGEEIPVE